MDSGTKKNNNTLYDIKILHIISHMQFIVFNPVWGYQNLSTQHDHICHIFNLIITIAKDSLFSCLDTASHRLLEIVFL